MTFVPGSIHRSVALSMNYELSPVAIHSLQRLHVGVQEWQIYINSKHNYSAGGLLHRCVWVWGFLKIILLLGCRFLTLKGKSVFRFRYFSTDPRNRNTLACIITHFLNNVNVTYKACTAISEVTIFYKLFNQNSVFITSLLLMELKRNLT